MEAFLLYLSAFLRPIFFANVAGPTLFEIAAIGMFVVLAVMFLSNAALRKKIRITTIDLFIVLISFWCIATYVIYYEYGELREVARLLLPLFTYVVAKNVLRDDISYWRMVRYMLWGFALPVVVSAALILSGKGAEQIGDGSIVNYWTGMVRWEGIYFGAHNMAHNMTFYLMIFVIYMTLGQSTSERGSSTVFETVVLTIVAVLAIYCLLVSQVRTALVGAILFTGAYLFYRNRKVFLVLSVACAAAAIIFAPVLISKYFPDVVQIERGEAGLDELGSGRLRIWGGNIEYFGNLPIDRQIAGVGLGNNEANVGGLDSHNDFLNLFIQTGIVGFLLFAAIQVLLLRYILHLPKKERFVYGALFFSVVLMNLLSNSYISRFGLGQMFYMIMAYVELNRRDENAVVKDGAGTINMKQSA